jgi:hypothetical protein
MISLAILDGYYAYCSDHPWVPLAFGGGGLLMALIGYFVAGTKGNGCWGCGLGCLLGPIGVIIAMLIPDRRH